MLSDLQPEYMPAHLILLELAFFARAIEVVMPERLPQGHPERGVVVEHPRHQVEHRGLAAPGSRVGRGASPRVQRPAVLVRVPAKGCCV